MARVGRAAGRRAGRGAGARAGAWWDKSDGGGKKPAAGGRGARAGQGKAPRTVKELADANTRKGLRSSSGGTYGFASPAKTLIEPEGKYLEDGWVEESGGAGGGFFQGLARMFGGKQKDD